MSKQTHPNKVNSFPSDVHQYNVLQQVAKGYFGKVYHAICHTKNNVCGHILFGHINRKIRIIYDT